MLLVYSYRETIKVERTVMGKEEETKGTCGHEMQWEWWHDGVGN